MKNNILFNFTINKENNTVNIQREFQESLDLVWDAWTKPEILDQWWAPKPWKSKTKYMDFRVGGRRFYAMVGPEGQKHWSIQSFPSITPKSNFKIFSAFTDQDENINENMPTSEWDLSFKELNGTTKISIIIKHKSLINLETLIEMGFQEGFTMTLNYLERLLSTLSQK